QDEEVRNCGGGDSAVDGALMLESIAKEVTLVHRRDEFRAHEHSVTQLKNSIVQIQTPFMPKNLLGNSNRIESVVLEKAKDGLQETVEVDQVLVNYGFSASLGPIKDWGLIIEKNSIVVNSKMETNITSVYDAVDICS